MIYTHYIISGKSCEYYCAQLVLVAAMSLAFDMVICCTRGHKY
jgi:hypothetical protein